MNTTTLQPSDGLILLGSGLSLGLAWHTDAAIGPLLYAIGLGLALTRLDVLASPIGVPVEGLVAILLGLTCITSVVLGATGVFDPIFAAAAAVISGWLSLSASASCVTDATSVDPVERRLKSGNDPARIEVSILRSIVESIRAGTATNPDDLAEHLDVQKTRVEEGLDWLEAEEVVTRSDETYSLPSKATTVRSIPGLVVDVLVRPIRLLRSLR